MLNRELFFESTKRLIMLRTKIERCYFFFTDYTHLISMFRIWFDNTSSKFFPIDLSKSVSMMMIMFCLRKYFKIFYSVVCSYFILMMNNFSRIFKFPPKMFLHYKSMFKYTLSFNLFDNVSTRSKTSYSSYFPMTLGRTEFTSFVVCLIFFFTEQTFFSFHV